MSHSLCWILSELYFLWLQLENASKETLEYNPEVSESPWAEGGKQGFQWKCRRNIIVNTILENALVYLISCSSTLKFLRSFLSHIEETGRGGCAKSFLIPSRHDWPAFSFSSKGICTLIYAPFQDFFNWLHRKKWGKASLLLQYDENWGWCMKNEAVNFLPSFPSSLENLQ